jgi:CheY-like chemotaxis protein
MSRILLADDSPHAQRMGERILRDEGHTVVTVSDGEAAMLRLKDVQPDLVIADVSMPKVTGYEICNFVKTSGNHPGAQVVLTAGAMEPYDEAEAQRVAADGFLKKPFEATALIELASRAKAAQPKATQAPVASRSIIVVDPEQVRAAVTVALDASWPAMVDKITESVLAALTAKPSPKTPA